MKEIESAFTKVIEQNIPDIALSDVVQKFAKKSEGELYFRGNIAWLKGLHDHHPSVAPSTKEIMDTLLYALSEAGITALDNDGLSILVKMASVPGSMVVLGSHLDPRNLVAGASGYGAHYSISGDLCLPKDLEEAQAAVAKFAQELQTIIETLRPVAKSLKKTASKQIRRLR